MPALALSFIVYLSAHEMNDPEKCGWFTHGLAVLIRQQRMVQAQPTKKKQTHTGTNEQQQLNITKNKRTNHHPLTIVEHFNKARAMQTTNHETTSFRNAANISIQKKTEKSEFITVLNRRGGK